LAAKAALGILKSEDIAVNFSPKEKKRLTMYIAGIMAYKFAFESINSSVSLFVLTRMNSQGNSNVIWANLVILFSVSQALGSSLSGALLNRFAPSRLMSFAIGIVGLFILFYNVIEVATSGTRSEEGFWQPWIIYPLYMLMIIFLIFLCLLF